MTKFQIILTGVFAAFILIGVLVFAFSRPNSGPKQSVLIWGPMPEQNFSAILSTLPLYKQTNITIAYVQKNESDFESDFINALASGTGPDVIFLSQDEILKQKNKLLIIPYSSYSQRTFLDTYIQEGGLFLDANGIIAFPILIDPMVMYWNQSIFSSSGIAQPPQYWDQFSDLSEKLTKKDGALNITQATVPLGEFVNINNAKDILSTLVMQAGNPIVTSAATGYSAVFSDDLGHAVAPAISALDFYTEFSNSAKPDYSWNRSLPNSQVMFTAGDLAVYFGYASELSTLRLKNPNLNFDVAPLPQSRANSTNITFGRMLGLAITKDTKSATGAFEVVAGLSTPEAVAAISKYENLPPVRRDLLTAGTADPFLSLFYTSALWSQAWLDPDPGATSAIFQNMIESVTGGRARTTEAVGLTQQELTQLLSPTQ